LNRWDETPWELLLEGLAKTKKVTEGTFACGFLAAQIATRTDVREFYDEKNVFLDHTVLFTGQIFSKFIVFQFFELLLGVL
jgi:hypothetical protein